MKLKEESEKLALTLNTQKTNIMASGPITSWQIDGETVETVTDSIFLAPKSLQILLLGRKAIKNLDDILKNQRHYFAYKCPSSQSYGFSSSHI